MLDDEVKAALLALIQLCAAQTQLLNDIGADLNTIKSFILSANPEAQEVLMKEFDNGRKAAAEDLRKTLSWLQQLQKQFSPKIQ